MDKADQLIERLRKMRLEWHTSLTQRAERLAAMERHRREKQRGGEELLKLMEEIQKEKNNE